MKREEGRDEKGRRKKREEGGKEGGKCDPQCPLKYRVTELSLICSVTKPENRVVGAEATSVNLTVSARNSTFKVTMAV